MCGRVTGAVVVVVVASVVGGAAASVKLSEQRGV